MNIRRRELLASTAAAIILATAGRVIADNNIRTIRFIPAGNLSSIDPVVTTGYPIRNHGYMVYDTLFAEDEKFDIQPQMVEKVEASEDALVYTMTLRTGLVFHDGNPVRAQDCVASIKRWAAKDSLGQSLLEVTSDLSAVDDNVFRFTLSAPFPLILTALGKASTPVCFIMPERIANTPPTVQIRDATGSGPFRFLQDEWVPGSRAVYEKFTGYAPRKEAASGGAGGKVVHVDRVEWIIIPDQSTAIAALKQDEADWFEKPDLNLLPLLEGDQNVVVDAYDPYQSTLLRFNQQQAPFNNIKVRQAVMAAVNQSDVLTAMVGAGNFKECKSFFFCGTPMSTGAGSEVMKSDTALGQQLLADSGYRNEKVVIISATDIPWIHSASLVIEQLLRNLGMNVELQAMDLGTLFARRVKTDPVENGGWSALVSGAGSVDFMSPAQHLALRGDGLKGWPGWPEDAQLEGLRKRWMALTTLEERKALANEVEKHAFQSVPYVPLGQRAQKTAYRSSISGILKASGPFFWNLQKF